MLPCLMSLSAGASDALHVEQTHNALVSEPVSCCKGCCRCSNLLHRLCHNAVHCHAPFLLHKLATGRFCWTAVVPLASQWHALWLCQLGVPV
jgi:hypothetical protein